MTEQPGFRVGDLGSPGGARKTPDELGQRASLDPAAFPTLSELVRLPSNDFRARIDGLMALGHQESSAAVQRALHLAAQLLPVIYRTYGGKL